MGVFGGRLSQRCKKLTFQERYSGYLFWKNVHCHRTLLDWQSLLVSQDIPADIAQKCPISFFFYLRVPLLLCSSMEGLTDTWELMGTFVLQIPDTRLRPHGQTIKLNHQTPNFFITHLASLGLQFSWKPQMENGDKPKKVGREGKGRKWTFLQRQKLGKSVERFLLTLFQNIIGDSFLILTMHMWSKLHSTAPDARLVSGWAFPLPGQR